MGAVAHLNAVISSPALRDAHNTALPKVAQFFTELGLNRALFERYKALSEDAASLSDEQRALLARTEGLSPERHRTRGAGTRALRPQSGRAGRDAVEV